MHTLSFDVMVGRKGKKASAAMIAFDVKFVV